jgi:hypothetical protein
MVNKVGFVGQGNSDRHINDFYATDPKTTADFLNVFDVYGTILEPACGMGHISKILERLDNVKSVVSTDKYDYGYGIGGIDFLETDFSDKYDVVMTNPPFKLASEFIKKSLTLSNRHVIMLLRLSFLESSSRYELFKNTPLKEIYVFSRRQGGFKGGKEFDENGKAGSKMMALAWFVWEIGYSGEPVIKWIE